MASSWNRVRIYATWLEQDGTLKGGKYTVTIPARVTSDVDNVIIPAGVFSSGNLSTQDGTPSLDILVPATDDPDINEVGWKVNLEIKFTSGGIEKYILDVPYANRPAADGGNDVGINLERYALGALVPQSSPLYKIGVVGGLAKLNEDGNVIDAFGNVILGGGGTGGDGTVTVANITDAGTVGSLVLKADTQAAARAATGAGTSNFDGVYGSLTGKPDLTLKADLVSGKIPTAQIPSIAITEFLGNSANQAAMLALVGQKGDWTIRTDLGTTWVITGTDTTLLSSWTALSYPTAPVLSVAGKTGVITLAKGDVGLDSVDNTSDATKVVASAAKLTTVRNISGVPFDGTGDITIRLDQLAAPTTAVALGGQKITGLGDGGADDEAVNLFQLNDGLSTKIEESNLSSSMFAAVPGLTQMIPEDTVTSTYPDLPAYTDPDRRWIFTGPDTAPATAAPPYGAVWFEPVAGA